MPRPATLFAAATLVFQLALPANAACSGRNILGDLPPDDLAQIRAAAEAAPFASGNFWQATRGDQVITIAGTYHLDDPRHMATLAFLDPHIRRAATVLVEAGPDERAALMQTLADDPSKLLITKGPTLDQELPPEVWEDVAQAMEDRGIPRFMAAKFKPWYLVTMLSIPACAIEGMGQQKGLDGLVIDTAVAAGIPVQGLEPYDTIFTIFEALPEDDLTQMMTATLAMESRSEDYFHTMVDSYFQGESRLAWELMRHLAYQMPGYTTAEVDADLAQMETVMMDVRNRAWIPVLTAAADRGPVFAAFGALHLAGEAGVLNLLQAEGFTITELQ